MAEWWCIEVFDTRAQASRTWRDAYQDALTEAAVTHGATEWAWHQYKHGVVFEVCFTGDAQWEAFRNLPAVTTALDAVPDRVNGLLIYRGRGGGAGARKPRKPKPSPAAAAVAMPEPAAAARANVTSIQPPGVDVPALRPVLAIWQR